MGKTSTFTIDHDKCNPIKWSIHDLMVLADFIETGNLQLAAHLSTIGMTLVLSEHHVPKGGDMEHTGYVPSSYELNAPGDLGDMFDGVTKSIVPIRETYEGPVQYAVRILIGDDEGNVDGEEYHVFDTEKEALAAFPAPTGSS